MFEMTHKQKLAAVILLVLLVVGGVLMLVNQNNRNVKKYRVETNNEEMVYVHVCGAVKKPGVIRMKPGMRIFEAIRKAGGPIPEAELEQINLAAFIEDGEQIYLPKKGELNAPLPLTEDGAQKVGKFSAGKFSETGKFRINGKYSKSSFTGKTGGAAKPKVRVSWPLDLNQATREQLELVPGIGPVMAERILSYRQAQGSFTTYEDLTKVNGIGKSKLEKFRPYLTVK